MSTPEYKVVTYGADFSIKVPGTLTPEEIQATVAEFYPEVANASYKESADGTQVTFVKQVGTKG